MRSTEPVLLDVLSDSFSRVLEVDVLHGTDPVATGVLVESWSLSGDLSRDPKVTGSVRFVRESVAGESWVPEGTKGVLSPFKATLQLTEVISAGTFERRVQLGLFDVVAVPFAEDTIVRVNGRDVVTVSTVEVDVESLDGRVLGASFESPRKSLTSALAEWRAVGLLPVAVSVPDASVSGVWPAEQGSRLDDVLACGKALGGVPVVDSFGQWVLADGSGSVARVGLGEHGTVVDVSHSIDLDNFYNVVVGDYEDDKGNPIRAVAEATGDLSPAAMGRRIVRFHESDKVKTQASANQAVRSVLDLYTRRDVDTVVTCVYSPLVELGDVAVVDGWVRPVSGVVQAFSMSDAETMQLTIRERLAW